MMKIEKFFSLLVFISLFSGLKAQFVTIPDTTFVNFLQSNYPACMSGNQMDTTCIDIIAEDSLVFATNPNRSSFIGLQYFDSLQVLDITQDFSGSLSYNSINLPSLLEEFSIDYPNLFFIPILPDSLKKLALHNCNFVNIGPVLPNVLPPALNHLEIVNCDIHSLPLLPNTLEYLDVSANGMLSYTNLPSNLRYIDLGSTLISPASPWTSFPDSLRYLDVSLLGDNSPLHYLTDLPDSLSTLICNFNNLACLPLLPDSLDVLWFDNNNILCLPNYIQSMVGNPVFNNLPLCEYGNGTNNPNGCPSAYGIFGSVIYDANNNCIEDGDEIGLENVTVKLYNNLGVLEGITSTSVQGSYFFPGNPNSYTVEIDTAMTGFGVSCSYPGIDSVFSFTSPDSVIRDIDFLADVNCSLGFDIGTQSINIGGMAFPGLLHKLDIISGDVSNWYGLTCSSGIGGTIVVDVTGPVSFNSVPSTALYPTIAGTTYTYTISDFGNLNIYEDFSLYFETDTLAQIGDSVCVNVAVSTSITGDFNLVNNNYTYCYYVGNSYDPNDKTVYPIQVSPGYNDWLIYTIQFQNTGTAPAFNIRLEDTLSALLDFSTFEVIGYKHANTYNLTNDKLTIFFPNIQLPDSTTNEPESKGYFQYRIKPISGLAEGTEINNTAHIFFDYNDAIITNTAVTSFIQTDLTIQEHNDLKFNVFPNPSKGVFFVNSDSYTQVRSIEVFNAIGQQVPVKMKKNGHITEIRFPENSKGLFVLKIRTDNEVFSKKVIIN